MTRDKTLTQATRIVKQSSTSPRLDVIRTKAPCGCTVCSGRGIAKTAGLWYEINSYPQGPLFPLSVSLDLLHSTEMIAFTWTFYDLTGLSAKWFEKPRNSANGQEPKHFLIHSEPLKWTRHLCLLKKRDTQRWTQTASGIRFIILSEMSCPHLLSEKDQEKESGSPIEDRRPHPLSLTMAPFRTSCPLNPVWQRQLPWSGHLILSPSLSDGKH